MIAILKDHWPYLLGLFLLVGHVPIRALLQPRKYSAADKILATWEGLSLDVRKVAKALGKKIPWLEPLVLVVDAIAPVDELIIDRTPLEEAPEPEPTTKPVTIEPPPEPPRAA